MAKKLSAADSKKARFTGLVPWGSSNEGYRERIYQANTARLRGVPVSAVKKSRARISGLLGSEAKKRGEVARSGQAHLNKEHVANAKGINGPQSDGWVDAHTRTEKTGKTTNVKAYRVPPRTGGSWVRTPGKNGGATYVGGPEPSKGLVRVPNHRSGGATYAPRGGSALQIWQRKQWGE